MRVDNRNNWLYSGGMVHWGAGELSLITENQYWSGWEFQAKGHTDKSVVIGGGRQRKLLRLDMSLKSSSAHWL